MSHFIPWLCLALIYVSGVVAEVNPNPYGINSFTKPEHVYQLMISSPEDFELIIKSKEASSHIVTLLKTMQVDQDWMDRVLAHPRFMDWDSLSIHSSGSYVYVADWIILYSILESYVNGDGDWTKKRQGATAIIKFIHERAPLSTEIRDKQQIVLVLKAIKKLLLQLDLDFTLPEILERFMGDELLLFETMVHDDRELFRLLAPKDKDGLQSTMRKFLDFMQSVYEPINIIHYVFGTRKVDEELTATYFIAAITKGDWVNTIGYFLSQPELLKAVDIEQVGHKLEDPDVRIHVKAMLLSSRPLIQRLPALYIRNALMDSVRDLETKIFRFIIQNPDCTTKLTSRDFSTAFRLINGRGHGTGRKMMQELVAFYIRHPDIVLTPDEWDLVLEELIKTKAFMSATAVMLEDGRRLLVTERGYKIVFAHLKSHVTDGDMSFIPLVVELAHNQNWPHLSPTLYAMDWRGLIDSLLSAPTGLVYVTSLMSNSMFWSTIADAQFSNSVAQTIMNRAFLSDPLKTGEILKSLAKTLTSDSQLDQVNDWTWKLLFEFLDEAKMDDTKLYVMQRYPLLSKLPAIAPYVHQDTIRAIEPLVDPQVKTKPSDRKIPPFEASARPRTVRVPAQRLVLPQRISGARSLGGRTLSSMRAIHF